MTKHRSDDRFRRRQPQHKRRDRYQARQRNPRDITAQPDAAPTWALDALRDRELDRMYPQHNDGDDDVEESS